MSAAVVMQARADLDASRRALLAGEPGAGVALAAHHRALRDALADAARAEPSDDGGPGPWLVRIARPNIHPDEWRGHG